MEAARPPGGARLQWGKALTDGGTTEAGRRDQLGAGGCAARAIPIRTGRRFYVREQHARNSTQITCRPDARARTCKWTTTTYTTCAKRRTNNARRHARQHVTCAQVRRAARKSNRMAARVRRGCAQGVDEAHLATTVDGETSSRRGTTTARLLRRGRARAEPDYAGRAGCVGAAQTS
jgi:hypothetical protein